MRLLSLLIPLALMIACTGKNRVHCRVDFTPLKDSLQCRVAECPGQVGIALIVNGVDTMTINDRCEYPMMSVFKLHQAVAVCDRWAQAGYSLDSVLSIRRDELNPDTWSPMLKYPDIKVQCPLPCHRHVI